PPSTTLFPYTTLFRSRVDVDEPGRDDAVLRVDDARPVLREIRADRRDASAVDRDVGAPAGCSRPIDHGRAADKKVRHDRRRSRPDRKSTRLNSSHVAI